MTDFSPNVEVVLSSDLFEDDPCFEDMSAPALAVLDAYMTGYGWLDGPTKKDCCGVAAALRAAADQVLPEEARPEPGNVQPGGTRMYYHERLGRWEERQQARRDFLAIAAELEALPE